MRKVVVIYESMFGNTHLVADAIAAGFGEATAAEIVVVPVAEADQHLDLADVIVVGGPTHAHGMSRDKTRKAAIDQARESAGEVDADPDAGGPGLREWFDTLGNVQASAAAFDTRFEAPAVLTGRASKGIARELVRHGCTLIDDPQSFLVDKGNRLEPNQEARARVWGAQLAARLEPATPRP
jgi:hypothetical protein